MSDEFSAGVQILLKRIESNPEEIKAEYGKWGSVRDAVFAYKERGERSPWLRGLTEAEISVLHEKLNAVYRSVFDEWVMKQVLDTPEEEERTLDAYQMAQGKRASRYFKSWSDPRMAQNNVIAGGGAGGGTVTLSNSIGTGTTSTFVQSQLDTEPSPAFLQKIKKGLGL